jgi:hypothetical protein
MKKLINRVAIMIVMARMTTTINAQLPQMEPELFVPSTDGKVYFNYSSSSMELYNFTSGTHTSRTTKVRDIFRVAAFFQQKGQEWVYTLGILAYPDVDTLQLRMATNNYSGPFGNFVVASSGTSPLTNRVKTFSLNGQNDGQYVPINTTDGTWTDAVYEGVSGFKFKKWTWKIDSLPSSQCDVNGLFYYNIEITVESLRHPLGSAPHIAPYYFSGPASGPHKITDVWRSSVGIKKVDASFTSTALDPANPLAGSTHNSIDAGFTYYPTNYYDSVNCKKLGMMFSEKVGNSWILIHDTMKSPFWHKVDQVNTGSNRTDAESFFTVIKGLKDTTLYKVELYSFLNNQKTIEKTQQLYTKKLYVEPSIENILVTEVTHNTAKVTLTYYLGNTNATPLELSVLGASGSMFTRSFTTAGIPGTLVTEVFTVTGLVPNTAYAVHPKKDAQLMKPIVPFTTLVEPIVITTIDPWSWTSDAVTGSGDGLTAIHTIRCTPGNDGAGIYILVTDSMGNVVKETGFIALDAANKTVSIDGMLPNTVYTFRVDSKLPGQSVERKGVFTWKSAAAGGGNSAITSISDVMINAYPNPVTDILHVDNLKKGTEIELYTQLGKKVQSTTEKTMDVSSLPVGIYFLKAGAETLKVEKR